MVPVPRSRCRAEPPVPVVPEPSRDGRAPGTAPVGIEAFSAWPSALNNGLGAAGVCGREGGGRRLFLPGFHIPLSREGSITRQGKGLIPPGIAAAPGPMGSV